MRPDVIELLTMYEGPNPSNAYKATLPEGAMRSVLDRDRPWITDDPKNGRWLILRTQMPEHLENARDIAFAAGLIEETFLELKPLRSLRDSVGLSYRGDGDIDALVRITDKGRAALAEHRTKARRKTGRPKKTETPGEQLVIGAIKTFLKERGQDDPPTGRQIQERLGNRVQNVSRFVRKIFGTQKAFEAAWRRGDVEVTLARREYAPERHGSLRDDDGSRATDDDE